MSDRIHHNYQEENSTTLTADHNTLTIGDYTEGYMDSVSGQNVYIRIEQPGYQVCVDITPQEARTLSDALKQHADRAEQEDKG